jgi:rSAM/selenodomain-associated transferase 1
VAAAPPDGVPLLVFTRTPVPGRVKTRLIPAIGAERAANLHRAMLWRAVETAVEAAIGPVGLWCSPGSAHPYLEQIRRSFGISLHAQSGADLGERMHRALAGACCAGRGALLIGTDCPFLQASDLREAVRALGEGSDAVIGPALDGGYYLIGVRASDARIFSGIEWGSDGVLAATLEKFRSLGWRWHELTTRRDVDRPGDLPAIEDLLIY